MTETTLAIQFLGAAGTVTGSKHLISIGNQRVLLDCGLFQGLKHLRERNWTAPPFRLAEIGAIVLSHAHLDHSGYLPALAKRGLRAPIFCTPGTADLARVLLLDAAHLQEEEADFANRRGFSKHHPALPLYTTEDAEAALKLLRPQAYDAPFTIGKGINVTFHRAGHILGSAIVEIQIESPAMRLVFSGDLGRWNRPILRDPALIKEADVVLVESTYGDRSHPGGAEERLAEIVNDTAGRSGVLVVPAFAVGRTQELIWTLRQLEDAGRIPSLPVFVDSPMAIDVTEIYGRHPEDHDLDMQRLVDDQKNPLRCKQSHFLRTADQSKSLNHHSGPMIIISASGMATGGRVLHHLERLLPDPGTTVLLPGFQAAGTRGRSLQEGAREVRIHGRSIEVRAKVVVLDGLSAHADRGELLRWLGGFTRPPKQTFVVHGEPHSADQLAATIRQQLHWNARAALDQEKAVLG